MNDMEKLKEWVDASIKKYGNGNSTFEGGAMQVLNTLKWNLLNGCFSSTPAAEQAQKPTADAGLVEELDKLIDNVSWVEYDEVKPALQKLISHYRPTSQTDIVGLIDILKYLDRLGGLGHKNHEMIREALRKFSNEKGGV